MSNVPNPVFNSLTYATDTLPRWWLCGAQIQLSGSPFRTVRVGGYTYRFDAVQ